MVRLQDYPDNLSAAMLLAYALVIDRSSSQRILVSNDDRSWVLSGYARLDLSPHPFTCTFYRSQNLLSISFVFPRSCTTDCNASIRAAVAVTAVLVALQHFRSKLQAYML